MVRGLALSLIAGVSSAVYGISLDVAAPIAEIAERYGAGIWKGNVLYLFCNSGAFVTAFAYSAYLARRSGSFALLRSSPRNHLLALATGTLWYGQFFFYNLGHVRLAGDYAFTSWAIHMILLVLLSQMSWRRWCLGVGRVTPDAAGSGRRPGGAVRGRDAAHLRQLDYGLTPDGAAADSGTP